MTNFEKAADLLMQARQTHQHLPGLPADCTPTDLAEAYGVQAALTERLLIHYGGQPAGYKIACTNEAAQRFLNLDAPFHGPLLSSLMFDSPASLKADDFSMRAIEPEFGFEMAGDLPPRATPYHREEVTAAVGDLLPSIEIVDSRYEGWTTVGAACLIADQAAHGAWVIGQRVSDWRRFDLAAHEVTLFINGEWNQTGRGEVVLGHPLNALTWLANALSQQGHGLKTGDFVTTGVCVDTIYNAAPGDRVKADFGALGEVVVEFGG